MVRKVTAGLFHSIDGVVEAPDQWQFDQFDDEIGAMFTAVQKRTDAVILGRKGFEEWAAYWPTAEAEGDIADFLNGVPKYVASNTLKGPLSWQNSKLIEGDLDQFVRALRAKPGGEIAVMGGISIVRHLFLAGLIDELSLITHPVIAGEERRHLFQPGDPVTRLKLLGEQRTSRGNVIMTYGLKV